MTRWTSLLVTGPEITACTHVATFYTLRVFFANLVQAVVLVASFEILEPI